MMFICVQGCAGLMQVSARNRVRFDSSFLTVRACAKHVQHLVEMSSWGAGGGTGAQPGSSGGALRSRNSEA
jgi:hypothetical protein